MEKPSPTIKLSFLIFLIPLLWSRLAYAHGGTALVIVQIIGLELLVLVSLGAGGLFLFTKKIPFGWRALMAVLVLYQIPGLIIGSGLFSWLQWSDFWPDLVRYYFPTRIHVAFTIIFLSLIFSKKIFGGRSGAVKIEEMK